MENVYAHDAIARRAYELWELRGHPVGSPETDWYAAERELRARHSQSPFYLSVMPEPEEGSFRES